MWSLYLFMILVIILFRILWTLQDTSRDKLAEAMAHVHEETTEENVEHIQLNMDVASETVETSDLSEEINQHFSESQNLSLVSLESTEADPQSFEDEQLHEVKANSK